MNTKLTQRYNQAFNEVTSNYKEKSSGIGLYFIPIVVLIVILQIFEVIEFISNDYKTVLIIYLTLISLYFAANIWMKSNINYYHSKYTKFLIFIPLFLYYAFAQITASILVDYVNIDVDQILRLSNYTLILLAIIIVLYATGNQSNVEKAFANIHYRTSVLCLNYLYTLEYKSVEEFNDKCVLIEKLSVTCVEIRQLYTEAEVEQINEILDDVESIIKTEKKHKSTINYITWLRNELDKQTMLL